MHSVTPSVFTVPGGGGPLARHAAALIRTTIAFATLTYVHEQRASLAAHHISPNCCYHHSTTLRLRKPRFFTAAAFTARSARPSPSSQRKRSSGKSTIASFNAQTPQHAHISQPTSRPHRRFYAFTITFVVLYNVVGALCSRPSVASWSLAGFQLGDQQGSRSTAVSETACTAWPALPQLCSHHTRPHDTL